MPMQLASPYLLTPTITLGLQSIPFRRSFRATSQPALSTDRDNIMTSSPESQEPRELPESQFLASTSDGLLPSASAKIPGQRSLPKRIAVISFEAIVTLVPLLFIILAFCANSLDGKELSKWGEKLQQLAKYVSTRSFINFRVYRS
jgi:hypothetical protein